MQPVKRAVARFAPAKRQFRNAERACSEPDSCAPVGQVPGARAVARHVDGHDAVARGHQRLHEGREVAGPARPAVRESHHWPRTPGVTHQLEALGDDGERLGTVEHGLVPAAQRGPRFGREEAQQHRTAIEFPAGPALHRLHPAEPM